MTYSKEKLDKIRQKMINLASYRYDSVSRRGMCVAELVRFATDPEIMGFEDPKSRADLILSQISGSRGRVECWREECTYSALYDSRNSTVDDEQGDCGVEKICTKDAWNNNPDMLRETSAVAASSEQIGFICIRAACDFNCGYADGGSGSFNECAKEISVSVNPAK